MKYITKLNLDQFIELNDKRLEVMTKRLQKTPETIFNDSISYGLIYELTVIIQHEPFTVNECERNNHAIYVFEDNIIRSGYDNGAIIRDCANSFGLITTRFPGTNANTNLSESDIDLVQADLDKLLKLYKSGKTIYLSQHFGSELANHAPKLHKHINQFIIFNLLDFEKE